MAKRVEAWEADDRSLHPSEKEANEHNAMLYLRGAIQGFVDDHFPHGITRHELYEHLANNLDALACISASHKFIKEGNSMGRVKEQLIDVEEAGPEQGDDIHPGPIVAVHARPSRETAASQMKRCDNNQCGVFIFSEASVCWKCKEVQGD